MGRLAQAVLEFVFPARCVGCESGGAFLCDACSASLPVAMPPRCARCWRPGGDACSACHRDEPPFDGLRAAFVYRGVTQELVRSLKYRGTTALAEPMARHLVDVARRYEIDADVVVPVPLAGLRRRTRGYNQAEELARFVGRDLRLPVERLLERRRNSPAQARAADAVERRRNVEGAFVVKDEAVGSRRVLLIDDVTTTGATLSACAAALKRGGARSVWALTFAIED